MSRRIIHILHHSPSTIHNEPLSVLLKKSAWHLETAWQQQRYLPDAQIECWTPERKLNRQVDTEYQGIRQRFFPAYGVGYLREFSPGIDSALAALRGAEVDIFLHGSVSYFSSWLLWRFGKDFRFFVQNHGERPTQFMYSQGRPRPVDFGLRTQLERRAFAQAQHFLCLNPEIMQQYASCGVPADRLSISTMGVTLSTYYPDPQAARQLRAELKIAENQICIGFCGRLAGEKQIDLLLTAMTQLPATYSLVLVGDGPLMGDLQRQVVELQLEQRVRFAGYVAEPLVLSRYYNAFDLLVLPSRLEGFGVVLIEALATGTPVLASSLPGTRLIISDPQVGELLEQVTPETLAAGILDINKRVFSADRLVARANEFSWQTICAVHQLLLDRPRMS